MTVNMEPVPCYQMLMTMVIKIIITIMTFVNYFFMLIGSKRCKSMQVFIYCEITPHVSGVHRTHHQEYVKL